MSSSTITLSPGARVCVEGLQGVFEILDWDRALVRLRSAHGVELRVGRLVRLYRL